MHKIMNTAEAASYLGVSKSVLEKFRVFGGGPVYVKIGRRVIYHSGDLEDWLSANKFTSTAEYTP